MKNLLIGTAAAMALLTACGGEETGGKIAAPEITIGDVELPALRLAAGDPADAPTALEEMSLHTSGAGRISYASKSSDGADATFTDVSITVEEGETPIRAGSLVIKGLDMADGGASFSQMTFSDLLISPDDEDGALRVASLELTNPSPQLASWVSSLLGDGDPEAFPAAEAFRFGGLSLNGLSLEGEGLDELKTLELGAFDVRDFSSSGIGSMMLEGFKLDVEDSDADVDFAIDSMQLAGLNELAMTPFLLAIENGGDEEAMLREMSSLITSSAGDPGYDAFIMEGFLADVSGVTFDMPSVEAAVTRDDQGRATRSVTKPYTFSVSADPEGELGAELAGPLGLMGYEQLNFSGATDIAMNPETDIFSADAGDNFIALDDGFKLSLGGSFSGLKDYYASLGEALEGGGDSGEATLDALSKLSIDGLQFEFEDNSIVERGFEVAGAMSGQDPETLKAQAMAGVAAIPFMAGSAGVDAALANDLSGALAAFLADSGTLTLKLDPDEPITPADFQNPAELTKERLGFSASTD